MMTSNYSWQVYGEGGVGNPDCRISAFRTDPSQTPPQWQETLNAGDPEYAEAAGIILRDRADALTSGDYQQKTVNTAERRYIRTAPTGNPCMKLAPGDPPDKKYTLEFVTITEKFRRLPNTYITKVTVTIEGLSTEPLGSSSDPNT
jgi:hypothetical protein